MSDRSVKGNMLPLRRDDPESDWPVTDATGCSWESAADALGIGLLGFCGCGMADTINADVLAWLRWRKAVSDAYEAARPPGVLLATWVVEPDVKAPTSPLADKPDEYSDLIGYCLDRVGLIEHGGSIGGSWLTDKGKRWLAAIDAVEPVAT